MLIFMYLDTEIHSQQWLSSAVTQTNSVTLSWARARAFFSGLGTDSLETVQPKIGTLFP